MWPSCMVCNCTETQLWVEEDVSRYPSSSPEPAPAPPVYTTGLEGAEDGAPTWVPPDDMCTTEAAEAWLQRQIQRRALARNAGQQCATPGCPLYACPRADTGFCCYACPLEGAHDATCSGEDYVDAGAAQSEPEDMDEEPPDLAAGEGEIAELALQAARAERHLLAEQLFAEVRGRGLGDDLRMKLEWKCDWIREMIQLWHARGPPEWQEEHSSGTQSSWWRRDDSLDRLSIQCECCVDLPIFCAAALLYEVDLAVQWLPWFTASEELHNCLPDSAGSGDHIQKILRAELMLPKPFNVGLEFLLYGFGSIMLAEHGVVVVGGKSIWTDSFWGHSLPWPPALPRMNFLNAGFILEPIDDARRTKLCFMASVHAPNPQALPIWVVRSVQKLVCKQFAGSFHPRIQAISQDFPASEYFARIKRDPGFYRHLERALIDYKQGRHPRESLIYPTPEGELDTSLIEQVAEPGGLTPVVAKPARARRRSWVPSCSSCCCGLTKLFA